MKNLICILLITVLISCGPSKEEIEQREKEKVEAAAAVIKPSEYLKTVERTNDYMIQILTVEGKKLVIYTDLRRGVVMQPL